MRDRLVDLRAAAREGDDSATAALVMALQPTVWTYCTHVGPTGDEVALVEAAFLHAFDALAAAEPEDDDVEVWALRGARAACAAATRRLDREGRRAARSPWRRNESAPTPSVLSGLERREIRTLCSVLGLDEDRAARVIDASVATVRVRLAAARREMSPGDATA